ncbi:MAG TPA: glycosyltransferase [Candidatus Saccharimonadales bacterium]|nr:glycosyltransferase [Candidatus Saccharimonadales bacterium]
MKPGLKVAIVCDWLLGTGGAERVVLELHRMFPEAPIYTSQYDHSSQIWYGGEWFQDADVRTTWLQRLPKGLKKFLPVFRAWAFSRLDLSDYDLVISSSGAEAKAVKTGPQTLHICYCHSPTHYYWSRYDEYLRRPGFGRLDWLARLGLRLLVGPLRRWDRHAAQNPDVMVANSSHTQAMIQKYYKRDSQVIHPPVDVERFKPLGLPDLRQGFVTAGRQTPYKRIDLAVAACSELKVPLIVIGNGPEHKKLRKMAGRSVTFLTSVTDEEMVRHFQTALGFIFPTNVEDFGVTAVEAMAAGTPVIAYQAGGVLDYIVPGKTGMFFEKQTVKSLVKTLEEFSKKSFDQAEIVKHAQVFSAANFRSQIQKLVDEQFKNFRA